MNLDAAGRVIGPEAWSDLFENIKSDCYASRERKVLVFVPATNADSVAAIRILEVVLRAIHLPYSVYPVTRYAQVQETCESELTGDFVNFRTIFFINCGAQEDLLNLFTPSQLELLKVVVIDSHRPIHYNNFWHRNIWIFHDPVDGEVSPEDMPKPDGLSDCEDEDEVGRPPPAEGLHGDDGEDSDDDSFKENVRPLQRQRLSEEDESSRLPERQAARAAIRRKRKEYLGQGQTFSKPAACLLFDLAYQLQQDDPFLLWMSIVGLTDHLVHQQISPERYAEYQISYETRSNVYAPTNERAEVTVQGRGEAGAMTYEVDTPSYGSIEPVDDYHFTLMRHWSLHESMLHSTYVATRLKTWHDRGRKKLEELIARMGFPLQHAKASFAAMRPFLQQQLGTKLTQHGHNYRLDDDVKSFIMKVGYAVKLCAADAVHGVTALLEVCQTPGSEEDCPMHRFWEAWEALGVKDNVSIKRGIELSKRLQRAILSDGGLLIGRKAVRELQTYRLFNLSKEDIANRELLSQPLALLKLGMFLREAHWQETNKRKNLVLVGPKSQNPAEGGFCLVAGINASGPELALTQGNTFGQMFKSAALRLNADVQQDGFETSIIKVQAEDVIRFLRELATVDLTAVT
ncbi:hypothetical protein WJX84_004878 [Apatococcus fuscideae]|uniref:Cell division control protein 45 n=1 Tax=Apatococcus fuscideae TaxID=2026836 RepID=A0AAW1SY74_9CHLO